MPTLICTLLPTARFEPLLPGLRALHETGEAVVLWAPHADLRAEWLTPVCDRATLERAWEDEQLPLALGGESARLPPWLPVADCGRVLAISAAASVPNDNMRWAEWRRSRAGDARETALLEALFSAGSEAVEILAGADIEELHQSWTSGRRTGLRLFQ